MMLASRATVGAQSFSCGILSLWAAHLDIRLCKGIVVDELTLVRNIEK